MFMHVKLLNGFTQTLTYKVPEQWDTTHLVGSLVKVPLQQRIETAIVQQVVKELSEQPSFTIKPAYAQEPLPDDPFYYQFITKLSNYYALDRFYFLKRVRHFLTEKELEQQAQEKTYTEYCQVTLTTEQSFIVESISPVIAHSEYYPALLHGVTGSGKTEVYKQLIIQALNAQKSVLLLLPEVSLAVQFTQLLKKQLPSTLFIYGFHSATSVTEKRALWGHLLSKQPIVIIGVHLPLFLPLPNLGLIIIDEEHEVGFQEKKYPRINTKEAALIRAQLHNIPIILGSATPSIASLYAIQEHNWHLFALKKRFSGAFPAIKLIKLTDKNKRKNFWISKELEAAIADRLQKKEQVIIFLNRRGYSFFVQCKKCGFIPSCCNCSVSLTLHNTGELKCHYCSYTHPALHSCSSCKAGESSLLKKGIGTQQVVSILEKLFPHARIARADLDTTVNKKRWQQTIVDFESGVLDILVGTQTITKGYHFPRVTLVGILWADINLSLPIYNAAEVSLQQIIQVAGRAGRQTPESTVIIQTMIDHPIFNYCNEQDYPLFYEHELSKRALVSYPPCVRLAELEIRSGESYQVDQDADRIADILNYYINTYNLTTKLLGPAQPPVHTIKNMHIRKIYLKSESIKELITLYKSIDKTAFKSAILFTPNPLY